MSWIARAHIERFNLKPLCMRCADEHKLRKEWEEGYLKTDDPCFICKNTDNARWYSRVPEIYDVVGDWVDVTAI